MSRLDLKKLEKNKQKRTNKKKTRCPFFKQSDSSERPVTVSRLDYKKNKKIKIKSKEGKKAQTLCPFFKQSGSSERPVTVSRLDKQH